MRVHDWFLDGYSVSDGGKTVVLHLLWNYPGQPQSHSVVRFSDVALYHFTHTADAILLDVEEVPVTTLIEEIASELSEWTRLNSLRGWRTSKADYAADLQAAGFKAWRIDAAIGFAGFVIARTAE
jgi:hypothetical protein